MRQDPIEAIIRSVSLSHGFHQLKKHKWQLALTDQITAGVLMYGLHGVPAGMKQSELVFSLSYLPTAHILNWSPQGLSRSKRDPHPSLTWNAKRHFPVGNTWHAVLDSTHREEEIATDYDKILGRYFVPFVRKNASLEAIVSQFEEIGGWAALQFHFALLILSDGPKRIGAKASRIARRYGVPASSAQKLVYEYSNIPGSYVEKLRRPNQIPETNVRGLA